MTDIPTLANFIDNAFVAADASAETLAVTTPHTGAVIAHVPLSPASAVDAAVASAKQAFDAWSQQTLKTRASTLLRLLVVLQAHASELAQLIVREHGKTLAEAHGDVAKGLETLEYAVGLPQLCSGHAQQVSGGVSCRDERVALGVVCGIVPFNFPLMVPFWTIPLALGMGNTYVLKPSEKCPLTMLRVAELAGQVLPPGVLNLVNGGQRVAEMLVDHADTRAVAFVGSSAVARMVHVRASVAGKRVVALGGAKNHLVALPDCDVEMAARDIVVSFTGCAGQRCMAASVLLVVGEQPELLRRVVERARQLMPGTTEPQAMGPVIDQAAFDRITSAIEHAETADHAEVLLDGRRTASFLEKRRDTGGFWLGPTVLLHRAAGDQAVRQEVFGPVLSVLQCRDLDHALAVENSSAYGNAACVYTRQGALAEYFERRVGAAMVGVNVGVPVPREPFSFGGTKDSRFGYGDITGDAALDFFSFRRKVTTKWGEPSEKSWMH
ncbi:hypothetical protein GGI15_004736 [Coemansia interrupta]|uniref:Aldehyde dehydrogenase domain-containing protein n=1 Tax=Coemansia interrupta TaxID=1126814 RepID=A0A9W8H1E0_9FUNG|nr:hypothetical protein GGI15_004736 [Coemansia interrupta]